MSYVGVWKSFLGRGNKECKCFKVGLYLLCLRISKEVIVVVVKRMRGKMEDIIISGDRLFF